MPNAFSRQQAMWAPLLALGLIYSALGRDCPPVQSCSQDALEKGSDPCCVPSPSGLFVFRQRFEPDVGGDMGSWGIDGLEVLDCSTQEQTKEEAYGPTYTHEEIGSFCHRSKVFGGDEGVAKAEGEWAQSEVGEGVEEIWERVWNTAGRYISTLAPSCAGSAPNGDQVAGFFQTLHELHGKFPVGTILADFDIIPSEDVTYALSELVDALSFRDMKPVVACDNTTLFSVSWPLTVTGQFQAGDFQSAIFNRQSNCPKDGIVYLPSTSSLGATTTTSHTWDEIYRPTPRAITKSHDEDRMAYHPDKEQLKFFKGSDEEREGKKEEKVEKQYWRDEL